MTEALLSYGLGGLFALSFLASTILPVASEAGLVALLLAGLDPLACVGVATVGNTLGAVTTWGLGRWGGDTFLARLLRMDEREKQRARRLFSRYGAWSLLLSWAPVVGDPLCLVAGLFDLSLYRFVPPVIAGKLARYAAIAWLMA